MFVRTETKKDYQQVFNVHYEAFNNREDESKLVERIRTSSDFIPALSLVAEGNQEEIVGHILLSKARSIKENNEKEVLVLAPVAVRPGIQKNRIGSELIEEGLKRAKKLGYGLVLLIGHPTYYPKFGFRPARNHGLELNQYQVPDNVFMVCELKEGELESTSGELQYPPSFFI